MLRTNREHLAMIAVEATVDHPKASAGAEGAYDNDGRYQNVPSMAGITYNFNIGDTCMNIMGEHVEPGVSSKNTSDRSENCAYMLYSCIGNRVKVITGDAKGDMGYVVGKHGGVHTMLYFAPETLDKLTSRDWFQVRSFGMGLELLDYPQVKLFNMDPDLLDKMGIEEKDGKLIVPVAKILPSYIMGSGKGQSAYGQVVSASRSDYDIMTTDRAAYKELGLDDLRFGDIVLLEDADNTYGRTHRTGSVTIGIIIHSDSYLMGHGPGVTTLMSCRESGILAGKLDKHANIANYLGVRKI